MTDDIWNAKRQQLEHAVVKAGLDLFEHTGSGAFKLPIQGTSPPLFIVVGDVQAIQSLVMDSSEESSWPECSGCGGRINPDYGKCLRCE